MGNHLLNIHLRRQSRGQNIVYNISYNITYHIPISRIVTKLISQSNHDFPSRRQWLNSDRLEGSLGINEYFLFGNLTAGPRSTRSNDMR